MSLDVSVVETAITSWYKTTFPQFSVVQGAVTNENQVQYVNGELVPYIALRFTDPSRDPRGNSFGGPRYDTYGQFCDVYCVANDPAITSQMAGGIMNAALGQVFPQTGPLFKTAGGGVFDLVSSADKPPIYVRVFGTGYTLNFTNQS